MKKIIKPSTIVRLRSMVKKIEVKSDKLKVKSHHLSNLSKKLRKKLDKMLKDLKRRK